MTSGAGPAPGASTMPDSTTSKVAPGGTKRKVGLVRVSPIVNSGSPVESSTVKAVLFASVASADPAS